MILSDEEVGGQNARHHDLLKISLAVIGSVDALESDLNGFSKELSPSVYAYQGMELSLKPS